MSSLAPRQEEVRGGDQICSILPSSPSPALAALPQPAAPLAVRAVPHEAVAPHELLAAAEAVVRLEARVRLHVLREVVLHLELLGADGAVEGPQVQVHVDVAVPHALVGEALATVAHEHFPWTPGARPSPYRHSVHAVDSQSALCRQVDRTVLQAGTFEGGSSYRAAGHAEGGRGGVQGEPGGLAVEEDLVPLHVQGEELGPGRGARLDLAQQRRHGAAGALALTCSAVMKVSQRLLH